MWHLWEHIIESIHDFIYTLKSRGLYEPSRKVKIILWLAITAPLIYILIQYLLK